MTHTVPGDVERERLDRYAAQVIDSLPSRARARRAAKSGALRLNGQVVESSRFVTPGDVLTYEGPVLGPPRPWLGLSVPVVYEDPDLAIVEKPAGLLVNGNRHRTLEAALLERLPPVDGPEALGWARPVHRLDFRTGGLVVLARTSLAQIALGRAFEQRRITKRYRAIVAGSLVGEGVIEQPLDGRASVTRWRSVDRTPSLSCVFTTTLDLWPETGRTHQLRRHLAGLGHPVLGCDRYTPADRPLLRGKGLYLWAVGLRLSHPRTGDTIAVEVPEPKRFGGYRAKERRRWERWDDQSAGQTPP